ncbi:MAG: hypothetical protein ACPGQQ_00865 [Candidatus Puniceispirillaceae bacterium]
MFATFLSSRFSGYLSIALCVAVIGLIWYVFNEGKKAGCAAQTATVIEKTADDAKKKIEIRRLDDDALVRRYCRWVYDLPYDQCVRTVKPIK